MVTVISHRLSGYAEQELSVAALEAALAAGVYGFEIDTRVTSDGVILVRHDRHLRTSAGWKPIDAQSHREVAAADPNIPTLEDFLACINRAGHGPHLSMYLDLKSHGFVREHAELIERFGLTSNVTVISWRPSAIVAVMRDHPALRVGFNLIAIEPKLSLRAIAGTMSSASFRKAAGALLTLVNPTVGRDLGAADIRLSNRIGIDDTESDQDIMIISRGMPEGPFIDMLSERRALVTLPVRLSASLVGAFRRRGLSVALYGGNAQDLTVAAERVHAEYVVADGRLDAGTATLPLAS